MTSSGRRAEAALEIGILIGLARKLGGMNKTQLAAKAGVDVADVSRWERGERRPGKRNLNKVLTAAGVSWELAEALLPLIRSLRAKVLGRESGESQVAPATVVDSVLDLVRAMTPALLPGLRTPAAPALNLEEEHCLAEEQFQRLLLLSAGERRLLVDNSPRFQTWPLAVRLCEASRVTAADSAPASLEWAQLALAVSQKVLGVEESWRERLEGYALGHVANAKRVGSELLEAQEDYCRAWELWKKKDLALRDEVLEVGWLLGMEASLLRDRRLFPQSLANLDQALDLASSEKARASLAIAKAHTLRYQEDYEGAIATLLQLPSRPAERQLALVKQFELGKNFLDLNRFAEAYALLPAIRELALDLDNDLELLRVQWLEGLTAAGLDRREQATTALEQVRRGFAAKKIAYDAALVSLDLAVLYLDAGRLSDVQRLALEMRPIFQTRGVHREALAAVKLFCEATERGDVTTQLTRRLAKYLERARFDESLLFEACSAGSGLDP